MGGQDIKYSYGWQRLKCVKGWFKIVYPKWGYWGIVTPFGSWFYFGTYNEMIIRVWDNKK